MELLVGNRTEREKTHNSINTHGRHCEQALILKRNQAQSTMPNNMAQFTMPNKENKHMPGRTPFSLKVTNCLLEYRTLFFGLKVTNCLLQYRTLFLLQSDKLSSQIQDFLCASK